MGDEPLISDLSKQHRESGGCWNGLAIGHPRKLVESSYNNCAVIDNYRSSLLNFILIAASGQLQVCKVGADCIATFRNDRATRS